MILRPNPKRSLGYMVGDICLDKDGIRGAAVFAEMATKLYSEGKTLYEYMMYLESYSALP